MPAQTEEEKLAAMMDIYQCDRAEATIRLDAYRNGFEAGRKAGQEEAPRFFRLAIGDLEPTSSESALWNNPVPLKR